MWSRRPLACIPIAVAILSTGVSARSSTRQAVHVGIVLGGPAPGDARRAPAMMAEANAIWRARGATLALAGERASAPDDDVRITVRFAPIAGAGSPRGGPASASDSNPGLGAIWFDEDGRPGDTITIDPIAIRVRLGEVRLSGRPIADWPPSVGDQVMGRAFGRVLAHELGHYLLASRAHASSGLMRASFNGEELAGWDRGRFVLDAGSLPRLRARLAQLELERNQFYVLGAPF